MTIPTSVLAGRIVDESGEALVASHASKRGGQGKRVRYRYYVSRALQHGRRVEASEGLRLPAAEVEAVVAAMMAEAFDDPLGLAEQAGLVIEPHDLAPLRARSADLASQLRMGVWNAAVPLITQVQVHPRYLEIVLDAAAMAQCFGVRRSGHAPNVTTLRHEVRLTRTGRAMRLIDGNGASARSESDAALIRLVLRAHGWWQIIARGEQTVSQLARHEGVTRSYLVRVLRLAFLSPKVIDAMLDGTLRAGIDASALTQADAIDPAWHKQERMLLAR